MPAFKYLMNKRQMGLYICPPIQSYINKPPICLPVLLTSLCEQILLDLEYLVTEINLLKFHGNSHNSTADISRSQNFSIESPFRICNVKLQLCTVK